MAAPASERHLDLQGCVETPYSSWRLLSEEIASRAVPTVFLVRWWQSGGGLGDNGRQQYVHKNPLACGSHRRDSAVFFESGRCTASRLGWFYELFPDERTPSDFTQPSGSLLESHPNTFSRQIVMRKTFLRICSAGIHVRSGNQLHSGRFLFQRIWLLLMLSVVLDTDSDFNPYQPLILAKIPPFSRLCPVVRPFLLRQGGRSDSLVLRSGPPSWRGNAPDTFAEPGDTRNGPVLGDRRVCTA